MMARAGAALLREADLLVPVPLHRPGCSTAATTRRPCSRARSAGGAAGPRSRTGCGGCARTAPLGDDRPRRSAPPRWTAPSPCGRPGPRASPAGAVLLVDDVLTSGATANACAAALKAAGAAGVDVLVAARVPDPRLQFT